MIQPSVAIVILNYNGSKFLQQFLPSVFASAYSNKRIIVADNASVDDSVPVVQNQFPAAEIIVLDKNYGFAEGYNQALKRVSADYYVLLNSDVEVTAGWIEPVIKLMESDKAIAACQPKILSFNNKAFFEYAGACGGWIDYLGYPFARGRIFDTCEKDESRYNDVSDVFWASGAAMFIRASVYHKLGGFYGYFFAHNEEIDLCWRIQQHNYRVCCCPASVVYHVGGGTLPKGNSRKVYLNFRNNIIMMHRNLPLHQKIWKMPLRFLLDIIFACKSLFSGDGKACMAVLKAQWSVLKWLFLGKSSKGVARPMRHLSGVYHQSIIWQYYVAGKKTFSEIVKKNL